MSDFVFVFYTFFKVVMHMGDINEATRFIFCRYLSEGVLTTFFQIKWLISH